MADAGAVKGLPKQQVVRVKLTTSDDLPETLFSIELQRAVRAELDAAGVTCAPVQIRVASLVESHSAAKEVMQQRMASQTRIMRQGLHAE